MSGWASPRGSTARINGADRDPAAQTSMELPRISILRRGGRPYD